jgi:hypothetical protein
MNYRKLLFTYFFSSVFSIIGFSQTFVSNNTTHTDFNASVSGSDREMLIIDVLYQHPYSTAFQLSILNEKGETLYRNTYGMKTLDKTFRIPKEQGKLHFTITNLTDRSVKRYEVSHPLISNRGMITSALH